MKQLYTGFHAIEEQIKKFSQEQKHTSCPIIYYAKEGPRVKRILSLARDCGLQAVQADRKTLDNMASVLPQQLQDHRGIILCTENSENATNTSVQLDTWIKTCPESALVVVLDSVTDPHNVGAILRSCDKFKASLLIVPERNSPSNIQSNEIIARSSAGANSWVPIASVTNLVRSVEQLKQAGFWVYGADIDGESLAQTQFAAKTCIIMGSEGSGMSHLLSKECDTIITIPTSGHVDSLNVSVAAGIILYEHYRQKIC